MKIENGVDPFGRIAALLRGASFAAANLECTISNLGESTHRYAFRAPAQSAQLLRHAGFHALGLANNHALDFGVPALHDCAAHLLRQGIQPVGIKVVARNACAPSFFSLDNGKKIALIAISAFDETSEIATASHRADLIAAIADARSNANLVACLVHWGTENSENISDEQRELARWLIGHGVDLVVGSHPHHVQPLDSYHGHLIAYSLGNLVFDGAPTVASWNRGALLEVGLNADAKISSVSLIPIALEDGLPQLNVFEDNRLGSR